MCRRITCSECGKPSFAGCGAHVEQVLADVPKVARCTCHERPRAEVRPVDKTARKTSFWPF